MDEVTAFSILGGVRVTAEPGLRPPQPWASNHMPHKAIGAPQRQGSARCCWTLERKGPSGACRGAPLVYRRSRRLREERLAQVAQPGSGSQGPSSRTPESPSGNILASAPCGLSNGCGRRWTLKSTRHLMPESCQGRGLQGEMRGGESSYPGTQGVHSSPLEI